MSHLGVDLLRSDTGHYMQWPPADDAPTAPVALPAAHAAERGRTWISMLGSGGATAPAVSAAVPLADGSRDRVGVYLSLVNWLILLLLFCAFLLANTLSANTALIGGTAEQGCAVQSAACAQSATR